MFYDSKAAVTTAIQQKPANPKTVSALEIKQPFWHVFSYVPHPNNSKSPKLLSTQHHLYCSQAIKTKDTRPHEACHCKTISI